jgi:hypothetical protein
MATYCFFVKRENDCYIYFLIYIKETKNSEPLLYFKCHT